MSINIREQFANNYITGDDIEQPVTVTIAAIEEIVVGDDERIVVVFSDYEKDLLLNKTNALAIADLHGDETDDWVGKPIQLVKERVQFKGKRVAAVRVRRPPQPQPQPQQKGGKS